MPEHQPKPVNLDLIQMVQQARMLHDREALPSNMQVNYWIESKPLQDTLPPTARAGEWVIRCQVHEADAMWIKIRDATEAGRLGYKSKVSTAPAKGQGHVTDRLIVVRTRDADDHADVKRVETELQALGITEMHYERIET